MPATAAGLVTATRASSIAMRRMRRWLAEWRLAPASAEWLDTPSISMADRSRLSVAAP
jgi:hypothetical protein